MDKRAKSYSPRRCVLGLHTSSGRNTDVTASILSNCDSVGIEEELRPHSEVRGRYVVR